MAFVRQTTVHGRRLSLSSSGGIQGGSSAVAQEWGPTMTQAVAASASTLTNYGTTVISSGTATALTFEIALPAIGVKKRIIVATSASEISFGGTATGLVFKPGAQGAGSTMFLSAANLAGKVLNLEGISETTAAVFAVVGSTVALTIG